jgi:hypothetical protein
VADNVTNELLLETLKAMQAKLSDIANDLSDLKADMRGLKGAYGGFHAAGGGAGRRHRLDTGQDRLNRTAHGIGGRVMRSQRAFPRSATAPGDCVPNVRLAL